MSDSNDLLRFAEVLFDAARLAGASRPVFEVRAFDFATDPGYRLGGTNSGYFDSPEALAEAALELDRRDARGVYVTLNPVRPALLARAGNRVQPRAKSTTNDGEAAARTWLFLDLDPARPSGIPSSDDEHAAALDLAERIRADRRAAGWPDPVALDSGNGAYLLWPVAVPMDEDGDGLIKRTLEAFGERFDTEAVHVDRGCYNRSRIARLPGTTNRKGDGTEDRPHRLARLLSVPERLEAVTAERLEEFAPEPSLEEAAPAHEGNGSSTFDLDGFIARHGLDVASRRTDSSGRDLRVLAVCPFNPAHAHDGGGGGSAVITHEPNGRLGFKCQHNGCASKTWRDLRALLEPTQQPILAIERTVGAWPVPRPLVSSEALPTLDFDACVPDRLARVRDYLRAVSVELQVPVDAVALLGLAIASATVMRRLEIEGQGGWREPLPLWAIPLLPSGERKSGILGELVRPIRDWQKARARDLRDDVAKSNARIETAERRLAIEKQKCAKGEASIDDVERLATELEDERENAPRLPSLVVSDATSEALARVLKDNGERALIASAEGDALEVALGRYSDGSASFGVWLSGHAGDAIEVRRRTREPDSLHRPALAVALIVQPDAVGDLFASRKARGLGFLARGLWARPTSTVGHRELRPAPVPEHLRATWRATLERGLDAGAELKGDEEPEIIRLDPEADRLFLEFRADVERALRPDGELGGLRDWGSKLPGAILRIGGVLAALTPGTGDVPTVDAETMRAALAWEPYLRAHALHVHRLAGEDPAVGIAERVLRWIQREHLADFSKRDAWRACRGGPVGKADDLDAPLELLEEFGWIRAEPAPSRKGPGQPPSPRFAVNPTPVGQNGHNGQKPEPEQPAAHSGHSGHSGPRVSADDSPPDRDDDADLCAELDRLLEVEP